jgi:hypothetical protein
MKAPHSVTRRQQRMLQALCDLYRAAGQAVHYSAIAQRLGIHNTATYEMLRLLEQEGYVGSEYVLSGNAGPGRSSVVFTPTAQAYAALGLSGFKRDSKWESAKRQILARLGQGEDAERALAEELIARLPDIEEPIIYCAEVLTALLLNVGRDTRQRLEEQGAVLQRLVGDLPTRHLLSLLPGIALGLALPAPAQRVSEKLIECSQVCQAHLQQLDEAKQKALAEFLRQVMEALPGARPETQDQAATAASGQG